MNPAPGKVSLEKRVIKKILPHRKRWLLVDRILDWNEEEMEVTAAKTFSPKDCDGHFDSPLILVVPGHLIAEALAQTAGIALIFKNVKNFQKLNSALEELEGKIPFLTESEMRFRQPVYPLQEVILSARFLQEKRGFSFFEVRSFVGRRLIAKGKITLTLKDIF